MADQCRALEAVHPNLSTRVNDLVRAIADAHVGDAAFAVVEKGNVVLLALPLQLPRPQAPAVTRPLGRFFLQEQQPKK